MISGPLVGMLATPDSSSPKYARQKRLNPGRARSSSGVRTATRLHKNGGAGFLRPRRLRVERRELVFVRRLELVFTRDELAPEALEPVLAANACRDFGHGLKPRGRERLVAFDARSVVAVLESVQSRRQPVDPGHQQPTGGESDLAALVLLDLVDLVGVRRVVADGSS